MTIVWGPVSCTWDQEIGEITLVEQAHDADISANDPHADGPFRTQLYGDQEFELRAESWMFQDVTWVSPTGTEQEAVDAWQLWATAPPEEPPPEEEEPPSEE